MFFRMYINLDRSFYRFVTIHACDRQTDRRTDGQKSHNTASVHYMQRGKNYRSESDVN